MPLPLHPPPPSTTLLHLPTEILLSILRHLSTPDLFHLASSCRSLYTVTAAPQLWTRLVFKNVWYLDSLALHAAIDVATRIAFHPRTYMTFSACRGYLMHNIRSVDVTGSGHITNDNLVAMMTRWRSLVEIRLRNCAEIHMGTLAWRFLKTAGVQNSSGALLCPSHLDDILTNLPAHRGHTNPCFRATKTSVRMLDLTGCTYEELFIIPALQIALDCAFSTLISFLPRLSLRQLDRLGPLITQYAAEWQVEAEEGSSSSSRTWSEEMQYNDEVITNTCPGCGRVHVVAEKRQNAFCVRRRSFVFQDFQLGLCDCAVQGR